MGLFGKSATCQARDAEIISHLRKEIARTGVLLTEAREEAIRLERQVSWWSNLAASYSEERDSYREDALKHRRSRSHLKQFRGSGAVAGSPGTTALNG